MSLLDDFLIFKIFIFGVFIIFVVWLLILLRRAPEFEEGPEVYTAKNGEIQVYTFKDWREAQKSAN